MRSLFDDLAFFEDVDPVRVLDGGEAVGDDERSAVFHQAVEGGLDLALGFGIDGSGGFVEEEDGRVFEESAGDGEALFLAAGEFHAALADVGHELLGEIADKGFGVGCFQGDPHFLIGCLTLGEKEIIADGAIEEERFLGNVSDFFAEAAFGQR